MSIKGTTIAIRSQVEEPARKVTKIVPYKEGGFGLNAPYHSAREGYLAKMPVDYNKTGEFFVHVHDMVGFIVNDRVKLSYHPDGYSHNTHPKLRAELYQGEIQQRENLRASAS
jgi:hypothetical protein